MIVEPPRTGLYPAYAWFAAIVVAVALPATLSGETGIEQARRLLGLSLEGLAAGFFWQPVTLAFAPAHGLATLVGLVFLCYSGRDLESLLGGVRFALLLITSSVAFAAGALALQPDATLFGLLPVSSGLLLAHAEALPPLRFGGEGGPAQRRLLSTWGLSILLFTLSITAECFSHRSMAPAGGALVMVMVICLFLRLNGFGKPFQLQGDHSAQVRARRDLSNLPLKTVMLEYVDPLLEKASRLGMQKLTRQERRLLKQAAKRLREALPSKP
ncbi:MAG: hypothetical protein SNJ52_05480 [Verrucomicrobiia bacterium]